ncbi:ABC transporter permease [Amycolatopsis endophytica]|uniref:Transport permease protein n=1 Tax=Amycolatopsis endophytica TaxID=860233 RepID=A0A853B5Y9_9PSEU|nr:ABC transporter permease [Amycolatopsis endophytica]NYI90151.1 ABC-2 type transport system permease protein [Amycolatopsis endophytica]
MHALTDSATMLRRNLRHALRYPSMTFSVAAIPIMMLLLFNYVFGGAIGGGLTGAPAGGDYLAYLVPGILLLTIGSATTPVAVAICTDLAEGIVARLRTMAIARASVLTGHVVGNVIQTVISVVLVLGVALLMGFRASAGFADWLLVIAVLLLLTLGLSWFSTALGQLSKTPEGASNVVLPMTFLLPFLSSAFVPLDSMPGGIRWFAEYQPFTAVIETLRGLLAGTPIGWYGWAAVGWGAGIALLGYLWSKALFNREPTR